MADVIWSDDADLFLKAPEVLECYPKHAAVMAEGSDGATGATGKTFTSATVGSGFITGGCAADQFLEITAGQYQGFYKIASLVAATLTLDRSIGASLTGLSFRVRTFSNWHSEAHAHYQDLIKKLEDDWEDWDDEDLHAASVRDLRDLCVARVLATVFRAAAAGIKDSPWLESAKHWEGQESRLFAQLGPLLLDADDDGTPEETTTRSTGSIQAGIS